MIIIIIIAIILLIVIQIYFTKRILGAFRRIFSERNEKLLKILTRIFLFWLNLYPLILVVGIIYSLIIKQRFSVPDSSILDYLVIYPFWIFLTLIFQAGIYFLIFDLLKIILIPVYKKYKEKFLKIESFFIIFITAFSLVYIPIRTVYDYYTVDITKIAYHQGGLPNDLKNFRLVFISDIQADKYTDTNRLKTFIDKVNQLNPDLVLIAGDVITSTPDYIKTAAEYIGMIKSKYGIYSCVGDHDNWAYRQDTKRSIREITDALDKYHVEMINNDVKRIKIDSSTIGITFITNTYVEKVTETLLNKLTNSNHTDFKILLAHQPEKNIIEAAAAHKYNLFLAGHTHGGQLTLLFPFIQLTPTLIETNFVRGQKYYHNMLAIVTRGLGMSIAPIRYNSTPEIVLINFQ